MTRSTFSLQRLTVSAFLTLALAVTGLVALPTLSTPAEAWTCNHIPRPVQRLDGGRSVRSRADWQCDGGPSIYLRLNIAVQRDRWYGWQTMKMGTITPFNTKGKYVYSYSPAYVCQGQGTYTWRTLSFWTSRLMSAKESQNSSRTSSSSRFTC